MRYSAAVGASGQSRIVLLSQKLCGNSHPLSVTCILAHKSALGSAGPNLGTPGRPDRLRQPPTAARSTPVAAPTPPSIRPRRQDRGAAPCCAARSGEALTPRRVSTMQRRPASPAFRDEEIHGSQRSPGPTSDEGELPGRRVSWPTTSRARYGVGAQPTSTCPGHETQGARPRLLPRSLIPNLENSTTSSGFGKTALL